MTSRSKKIDALMQAFGSVPKFARAAGVSEQTCYSWRRRGNIPSRHFGMIVEAARKAEVSCVTYESLAQACADGRDDATADAQSA